MSRANGGKRAGEPTSMRSLRVRWANGRPPRRSDMKTLPSLAAAGAIVLALLAAPLTASAAEPAEIRISGEITLLREDGTRDETTQVSVRAYTLHGDVVASSYGQTFYALNGLVEGSYLIQAETDAAAATWYGQASLRSGATIVSASTETADIVLRAGGSVSGTAAFGGPLPAQRPEIVITPYLWDPEAESFERVPTSGWVDYSTGSEPGFRIDHLAPGRYALRAQQWFSEPSYGDRWWSDAAASGDATLIDVSEGADVSGIAFRLPPWVWDQPRIDGGDRYDTATRLTRSTFGAGVPVVYVASGATWPDALSAGPAASALGGALLLTDPDELPETVAAELRRLRPERVVVVGSDRTVSEQVLRAIRDASAAPTTRIGGVDRYDTSRLIVDDVFDRDRTAQVFLATGNSYPDALSVGPIAGRRHEAVLLVDGARQSADTSTRSLLDRLAPGKVIALGADPSIRQTILDSLSGGPWTVERIAGRDRSETSFALNGRFPSSSESVYVVNEAGFADALAVSTVAAAGGANVALTPSDCLRTAIPASARSSGADTLVLVGGEGTLGPQVPAQQPCRS
ncbi:hypothetical protein GRS92_17510 [Rathayibacter sp. VKM Ac-2754]|nr:hypothetical protein [Rathayibacter sp. VKM Ac-2754]